MSTKSSSLELVALLILLISVERCCEALANKAVYMIENRDTKQCLSAGGVTRMGKNSNITLFKQGHALSKPCSDINSYNTTDFSQQWMVRIQKEHTKSFSYQVQLAMLNTMYYDVKLTAELRGEFMMYFPDKLYLMKRGDHSADGNYLAQEYVISDQSSEGCLTDTRGEKGILFVPCNSGEDFKFQKWIFTLVNEKYFMREFFNMTAPPA